MQIFTFLAPAGQALLPYLSEISIALIACALVMLGGEINAFLRRALRNQHYKTREYDKSKKKVKKRRKNRRRGEKIRKKDKDEENKEKSERLG